MAQPQSQPQLDIGRKTKTLKDIALPQSYQIAPMKRARVAPLIPYTLYLSPNPQPIYCCCLITLCVFLPSGH